MAGSPGESRAEHELQLAVRFRDEGRMGRARVCARRAAGWAVAPTYRDATGEEPPASALELLRWYRDCDEAPEPLRQAAGRLVVHVTPEHRLPHVEDPIEDARILIEALRILG